MVSVYACMSLRVSHTVVYCMCTYSTHTIKHNKHTHKHTHTHTHTDTDTANINLLMCAHWCLHCWPKGCIGCLHPTHTHTHTRLHTHIHAHCVYRLSRSCKCTVSHPSLDMVNKQGFNWLKDSGNKPTVPGFHYFSPFIFFFSPTQPLVPPSGRLLRPCPGAQSTPPP